MYILLSDYQNQALRICQFYIKAGKVCKKAKVKTIFEKVLIISQRSLFEYYLDPTSSLGKLDIGNSSNGVKDKNSLRVEYNDDEVYSDWEWELLKTGNIFTLFITTWVTLESFVWLYFMINFRCLFRYFKKSQVYIWWYEIRMISFQ